MSFLDRMKALLFTVALAPAITLAAEYPSQPIRLIVPYPPGGSTDMIARQYADLLGKALSQSVIVENRPGAATNIGADAVARATPDGHTLLFGGNGLVINAIFGPKPSFDAQQAFAPVSLLARVPFIVAANPKVPFSDPAGMIKAAQARPGAVTISSAQLHLYVELLKNRAKAPLLHVPYKGGAQAVNDAIAGQVDMVFALTPVVLPHVQAGTLKPIGVSSGERVSVLPNVPTFQESGAPGYDVTVWYGIIAPAGTPDAVRERLAQATRQVVANPTFAGQLAQSGVVVQASSPAELAQAMQTEGAFWRKLADTVPELSTLNAN